MAEKLRPQNTYAQDRLGDLKAIFPEAFAEGEVDWEVLRETLGESLENDGTERFGLFWTGKREARALAGKPSNGTLAPISGEGVNEIAARNIFIEGENLEVMKLLQKSYVGRIKMIYIDPPYNTGNDLLYVDSFDDPVRDYLKKSGQMAEAGELLTTNTRADGRFHSNWLNLMYPRLILARSLLRKDGLIFISIDDNEVHHLRLIMNEIFGEENFIEQIVWKNKFGAGALTKGIANVHEYILCYSNGGIVNIEVPLDEQDIDKYTGRDSKYAQRGGYVTQPLATTSKDARPNLRYAIYHEGNEIWPEKQWYWSEERFKRAYENDQIVVRETNGKFSVRFKQYLKSEDGTMRRKKPVSIQLGPFNQEGTQEIREIFGSKVFDFPKPSALVKFLFSFVVNDQQESDGIYLDFFSGSCPAAQAVLELNEEDSGRRSFIMVQLAEKVPLKSLAEKEGYRTVAEIGKERIRRVIAKPHEDIHVGAAESNKMANEYLGFRVLKLTISNYERWTDFEGHNQRDYQMKLAKSSASPLVEGWTIENVLTEIMLLHGFPLDCTKHVESSFAKNVVRVIASDFHDFLLYICLDKTIAEETGEQLLSVNKSDVVICIDSALTDEIKLRLDDGVNLFVI